MKQAKARVSLAFIVLVGLIVAAFLLGGSSRDDQAGLIVLRPLSVLAFGYALWGFSGQLARRHRFLLALAVAVLLLPLLQLIPLPPALWRALPGRALVAQIDEVSGLGAIWRPLSLSPASTWNAVYSLFLPLAVLLLGLRISAEERLMLVPVMLALGAASATFGIVQILGPENGPVLLYTLTPGDPAGGFFANRNHEAAFLACLFPALALIATSQPRSRRFRTRALIGVAAGLALVPLILITGSRAGLVAGAIGAVLAVTLAFTRVIAGRGVRARGAVLAFAALLMSALGLAALSVALDRGEAFTRLANWNPERDYRLDAWDTVTAMTLRYFPAGIGMGSFPEVYKIDEPDHLLTTKYFNHAHNDWIELVLTGGLPGALLLGAMALALAWRLIALLAARRDLSPSAGAAWLGAAILAILGFASTTDYPLRVPAMMCIGVLAVLWLACWRPVMANADEFGATTGLNTPQIS